MRKDNKVLISWSGGKDSCYAWMLSHQKGYEAVGCFNVMNENGKISRSHAITKAILEAQAAALGVPLYTCASTWTNYEANYVRHLQEIYAVSPFQAMVFGDIDIESHRAWEEKVSATVGAEALLPLWQGNRKQLVLDMLAAGIETRIVSCQPQLADNFLGELMTVELLTELEKTGVDVCGENGEFHTLVTNCPLFKTPLDINFGEKVRHEYYCFIEMELNEC